MELHLFFYNLLIEIGIAIQAAMGTGVICANINARYTAALCSYVDLLEACQGVVTLSLIRTDGSSN